MTATLEQPEQQTQTFEARGAIAQLFRCTDDEVLVEGPAGTGKSRGVLERIDYLADQYPGIRVLIGRKTRASMSQSILVTLEDHVWAEGHESLTGASRSHRSSYKYRNGSELIIAGFDDPERIKSTDYDIVYINEATELTLTGWEMAVGRLRNGKMPFQQAIADCNPDAPSHWLNNRADKGGMARLYSRHHDNPRYFTRDRRRTKAGDAYLGKLDRLTGVRALRLREGKWAAAEGIVYDNYDPAIHLVDRYVIPDSWRRIRVIDFGYTNPFTVQWWAIDGDGRMVMYRELYHTRRLVEDWAKEIIRLSEGETIEATITDHDAEDRATLERHGIPDTIAAHKAVTTGIEAVQSRLRVEDDGRPRLTIMKDSLIGKEQALEEVGKPTCLAEEIPGYAYPPGRKGRSIGEAPVKENDHACDGMRYGVAYEDNLGAKEVYIGGSMLDNETIADTDQDWYGDEDDDSWV